MDLHCWNYRTIFRPRSLAQARSLLVAAETRPSSCFNATSAWHLFLRCSLMAPNRHREGCFPLLTARLWDTSVTALGQMQTKGGKQPWRQAGHSSNSQILPQKHRQILHTQPEGIRLVHLGSKALRGGEGCREWGKSQQPKA